MSSTTEGRGNAVREDDELDLEEEGGELGQINGEEGDEIPEDTEAHDHPDGEPLSLTRQFDRLAVGLGGDNGSRETSTDRDNDFPPQSPRRDDDAGSIPDDSPSVQGSLHSSQTSSPFAFQRSPSTLSPGPSHRPFDLRFQSRLSTPSPGSLRPVSPSPSLTVLHSRNSSLASQVFSAAAEPESDTPPAPWEVVRWTRLRKITGQAFSEVGKRNFGRPTCMAVSTSIVVGTSRGIVLVFDYQQNLKAIIGPGTKAVESGAVSSLAISADHSTVASGHVGGNIFTWEISKSARPFLHIPPLDPTEREASNADGHVSGVSVIHIGFLGTRRTALISADDRGMAFSHLATRAMGPMGRAVRTLRILGRYYEITPKEDRPRKPSSVLAFSPLPLGNVDQATDSMGLVAMLTPYLLVIVSTTPVAETQHKAHRPKDVAAHGAMTATLTWFPAIRLKSKDSEGSRTKLVYCWSNVLTVVEVSEIVSDDDSAKGKRPTLLFEHQGQWKADESIVAVQWLSRSVLAVMTITQQLLILEQSSLSVTDSFDLIQKHIYHVDLFSNQLHSLVEQHDENDPSMHGVVADAFYMSFRAYKGRLFILGFNDISVGSLSNWADRLLALMESGDFIGAIRLATAYYEGNAAKLTVGLPEGSDMRHDVVQEKLLEMISASLKYAFGRNQQANTGRAEESQLEDLADASTAACIAMDDQEFLFDEVYNWYEEHESPGIFLDVLEHYIEQGSVRSLPPTALKSFISHFAENHSVSRLEEIICLLDTSTMDIDQATSLCKKHNLYDAFIYVWNRALGDYVGPLAELLSLVHPPTEHNMNGIGISDAKDHVNAMKMFPYLSYILTSRIYPTGDEMTEAESLRAKAELYHYLFSGNSTTQSTKGQRLQQSPQHDSFENLRTMLRFDSASFMSMLNEAFEDSFLNEMADQPSNGDPKQVADGALPHALPITRQYIISILLEVMSPSHFDHADTIYLDMFIARNLPKYPQYILLSGTTLHQVLLRLCKYPTDEMADDCQLSVEYLLSMYHPPDIQSMIPKISEARFFRILKSIYKAERQFPELILTYLADDEDRESVFTCIRDCLRPNSTLTKKQRRDVHSVVKDQAGQLADVSVLDSAQTVHEVAPDLHERFLRALEGDGYGQYMYLRTLFEPAGQLKAEGSSATKDVGHSLVERYVQLMCDYNPSHVADFVDILTVGDLRLDEVLPSMEESGAIDAAVILLARQGQVRGAMDRLTGHLGTLEAGLTGILQSAKDSPDSVTTTEAVNDLMESLTKYSQVGTWLCQGQSKTAKKTRVNGKIAKRGAAILEQPLTFEETLWLDLIEAVVRVARNVSPLLRSELRTGTETETEANDCELTSSFRTLIQRVFTALLASTTKTGDTPSERTDIPFLRILRTFLTRAAAASPSLSELRAVIASIFSAYTYEESLLSLANSILDKDLFVHVNELAQLRQRGWRPRGQVCEICRNRVWGPAAGAHLWEAWEAKQVRDAKVREARVHERNVELGNDTGGKGKGKGISHSRGPSLNMFDGNVSVHDSTQQQIPGPGQGSGSGSGSGHDADGSASRQREEDDNAKKGPVVVFACRHLYHRDCLVEEEDESGVRQGRAGSHLEFSCVICT